MSKTKDQIICIRQGEYEVMVQGKLFGPWACKGAAKAGLKTEQRRAAARLLREQQKK